MAKERQWRTKKNNTIHNIYKIWSPAAH